VWCDVVCVQQRHVAEVMKASSQFSKDTEEKMIHKMEASLRQREQQLDRLMDRLQKHVSHTHTHTLSLSHTPTLSLSLPAILQQNMSVSRFKTLLKQHLLVCSRKD